MLELELCDTMDLLHEAVAALDGSGQWAPSTPRTRTASPVSGNSIASEKPETGDALLMANEQVMLPRPVFQYTLDQIAMCLAVREDQLRIKMVHFDRLTAGRPPRDRLTAHNIADLGERPDWRVSETELLRWLKLKGYRTAFNRLY